MPRRLNSQSEADKTYEQKRSEARKGSVIQVRMKDAEEKNNLSDLLESKREDASNILRKWMKENS